MIMQTTEKHGDRKVYSQRLITNVKSQKIVWIGRKFPQLPSSMDKSLVRCMGPSVDPSSTKVTPGSGSEYTHSQRPAGRADLMFSSPSWKVIEPISTADKTAVAKAQLVVYRASPTPLCHLPHAEGRYFTRQFPCHHFPANHFPES